MCYCGFFNLLITYYSGYLEILGTTLFSSIYPKLIIRTIFTDLYIAYVILIKCFDINYDDQWFCYIA